MPSKRFGTPCPSGRGLFGKPANPRTSKKCQGSLPVGEKRQQGHDPFGGMKRRLLIAKGCRTSRESLLDEPTRGRRRRVAAGTCGSWSARPSDRASPSS